MYSLNYNGSILDIILPKKRDINGYRYGFIKTGNLRAAEVLAKEFHNKLFLGNKLSLTWCLDKKKSTNYASTQHGSVDPSAHSKPPGNTNNNFVHPSPAGPSRKSTRQSPIIVNNQAIEPFTSLLVLK